MKNLLLILVLGIGFSLSANAQTQVIKTNPLALAFGNFNVTYERTLNESSSLNIFGNYFFGLGDLDVTAFGVGAGWRYYFTHSKKPIPAGFYVQPQVSLSFGSIADDSIDEDLGYSTIGIGAELGYQWMWESGFVLDIGIGPNYLIISGDGEEEFDIDGVLPTGTLAIGYAF